MNKRDLEIMIQAETGCGFRRMAILDMVIQLLEKAGRSPEEIEMQLRDAFYKIGARDIEAFFEAMSAGPDFKPEMIEKMSTREIMSLSMQQPEWKINQGAFAIETAEWEEDRVAMRINECPVVKYAEKWNLAPEKLDMMCNIANETSFAQVDRVGIRLECPKRLGAGDDYCLYVYTRSPVTDLEHAPRTFQESWEKRNQ